ncbi:MAG: hypothetical protein GX189_06540 [Clostridiales bacterium]|nr:hypothetical protein [Clostridiales bacterium]
MKKAQLSRMGLLDIIDDMTAERYCGGWQEWYGDWWKRRAGCGPTVVSTILTYLERRSTASGNDPMPKCEFLARMNEMWEYVTPGVGGIPSTDKLIAGAQKYIDAKNLPIRLEALDIPAKKEQRPSDGEMAAFLAQALRADAPVAFLCLDNGEEKMLDDWHWVTLVSLEYGEEGVFADVTDEGRHFRVDLGLWRRTTKRGGGFVRFMPREDA